MIKEKWSSYSSIFRLSWGLKSTFTNRNRWCWATTVWVIPWCRLWVAKNSLCLSLTLVFPLAQSTKTSKVGILSWKWFTIDLPTRKGNSSPKEIDWLLSKAPSQISQFTTYWRSIFLSMWLKNWKQFSVTPCGVTMTTQKKLHLIKWADVKKPFTDGGLGLRSLSILNKALCSGSEFGDFGTKKVVFGKG